MGRMKNRTPAADLATGPTVPRSTVPSVEDEAILSRFVGMRCCHWMTASMACRPRSRSVSMVRTITASMRSSSTVRRS